MSHAVTVSSFFFSILKSLELTSKYTHCLDRDNLQNQSSICILNSQISFLQRRFISLPLQDFSSQGFNFNFTLVFTNGTVAKWLSRWSHIPKNRGSKPRNVCFSFFYFSHFQVRRSDRVFSLLQTASFYFNLTTFKHNYNHPVAKIIRSNCNAILM